MAAESKQPKNEPEAMEVEEDEEQKQIRLEKETTASVIAGNNSERWIQGTLYTSSHTSLSTLKELKRNFTLLERAVETIESRFTTRVLRTLPSIRRRLTSSILCQVISEYYGTGM